MNIKVRQATILDRDKIGIFLEENMPNRFRYPERWDWLNLKNPFINKEYGFPTLLATTEERIVGYLSSIRVTVKISDWSFKTAGWGVDSIVSEQFRGQGVATQLASKNDELCNPYMTLEKTQVSEHMAKKLGFRYLFPVPLLYHTEEVLPIPLLEEIASILSRKLGIRDKYISTAIKMCGLLKLICWLLKNRIKNNFYGFKYNKKGLNLCLEQIDKFDHRADDLWDRARSFYTFAVERTCDYLNWKYSYQPHMSHKCFYLLENGLVIGVLIIRKGSPPEHNVGVVCECYLDTYDSDKYEWLIRNAIVELMKEGASGIWVATADPRLEKILKANGFFKVRTASMMIHCDDVDDYSEISRQPLIGKGDHDWDQYPNLVQPSLKQFIRIAFRQK